MEQSRLKHGMMVPVLFGLYIYVVIKVILFKLGTIDISSMWYLLQRNVKSPAYIKNQLHMANFIPLQSISSNIERLSYSHDFINFFGNIVIFMPLGVFLVLMSKNQRMSCIGVFTRALGLSFGLECIQFVFKNWSFVVLWKILR